MNFLRFLLPFTYFYASRIERLKYVVYWIVTDWVVPAGLFLYFTGFDLLPTAGRFLLGYLAFISVYEIGYFGNDVYSTRHEENPRLRVPNFRPSVPQLSLLVAVRLLVFLAVTWYLGLLTNATWWAYYAVLALFFYLHNALKDKQLKIMTFIALALARYLAPIFIFLTPAQLSLILAPMLLNYVFYRTLMYMDSKGLTNMPTRKAPSAKVNYYLLAFGPTALLSLMTHSWLPLAIPAYYLLLWTAVKASGQQPPQAE
jgi:hypothetical protein